MMVNYHMCMLMMTSQCTKTTQFGGESTDNEVQHIDEDERLVKTIHDGLGKIIRIERYNGEALYSVERYFYNYFRNVERYIDADGKEYTYQYDAMGSLIKAVNPDESYSKTTYDYMLNDQTVFDEEGHKKFLDYDQLNRLEKVEEYNASSKYYTTEYVYDEVGNLCNVTNALGYETGYIYDQLNRLTHIDYPDSTSIEFAYDDNGNMISKIDQNGNMTLFEYDSLSRLVNKTYPSTERGVVHVLFEYDDAGNLLSSNSSGVVISYLYDARNRVLQESFSVAGAINSVGYSYDNASRIIGLTYPDDSFVDYLYDGLGRISSIDGYADFTYNLKDLITEIDYANGVTTSYTYDEVNRPTNILVIYGDSMLLNLTYGYDKSGSVTSIYDAVEDSLEEYSYDLLDRLVSSGGGWGTRYYGYDALGNRLTLNTKGSASNVTYTYDNMDRLVSASDMGFDWDSNGNILYWDDGVNEWDYSYDALNRLTQVQKDDSLSAVYTYDADGRRVRSWDTTEGTTDYVYNGLNIIDEMSSSIHERHIYAGTIHIASNSTDTVEYYHVDHLGSTRLKTAVNGSAIYSSNYEPFGPSSDETGSERLPVHR